MSSFGSQTRKRLAELRKLGADVEKIMAEVAEGATIAAVEKAMDMTPPNDASGISGTNTRDGELKQHWASDSMTIPFISVSAVQTYLANDRQYASYVNDGHQMDKHYVPGLIKNPSSGLLEMGEAEDGGIVVGTKTTFVPGIHMKEAGIGKYRDVVRKELAKRVEENFK